MPVFGPAPYADHWLPLAIAAVVLVCCLPLLGWWFTRPRPQPAPVLPPPPDVERARREALALISGVGSDLASGAIDAREASQRLSRIVREFLVGRGRPDVEAMTLTELRADPALAPVADLVGGLYRPAFGPDAGDRAVGAESSVAAAERLVATWR